MSLWDDYSIEAVFRDEVPHGVNNDVWRCRDALYAFLRGEGE